MLLGTRTPSLITFPLLLHVDLELPALDNNFAVRTRHLVTDDECAMRNWSVARRATKLFMFRLRSVAYQKA